MAETKKAGKILKFPADRASSEVQASATNGVRVASVVPVVPTHFMEWAGRRWPAHLTKWSNVLLVDIRTEGPGGVKGFYADQCEGVPGDFVHDAKTSSPAGYVYVRIGPDE